MILPGGIIGGAPLEPAGVSFLFRDSSFGTSHSFSGVNFGDRPKGRNKRWIVCCAQTFGSSPVSLSGTPTIAGISAPVIYSDTDSPVTAAAYRFNWFAAEVPNGTSGDIVFSTPSSTNQTLSVVRAVNLSAASVSDSDTDGGVAVTSLAIDCPAGGAVIGVGITTYSSGGPTSGPFANLTSLNSSFAISIGHNIAASVFASAQTGLDVSFDPAPNSGALRTFASVISIPYAL
jgi:hypothetical protein